MKFLAVFLVMCILFLSFTGMTTSIQQPAKKTCCSKMDKNSVCGQQKPGQQKDCEKQGCTMMFSCPLCGFLIGEQLTIRPDLLTYIEKPVSLYKIGDLSAYHPSDWKPPKTC